MASVIPMGVDQLSIAIGRSFVKSLRQDIVLENDLLQGGLLDGKMGYRP